MYDLVRFMSTVRDTAISLKKQYRNAKFDIVIDYFNDMLALAEELHRQRHTGPRGGIESSHREESIRTAIKLANVDFRNYGA